MGRALDRDPSPLRAAATLIVTLKDGELCVPVPGGYPIIVGLAQLLVLEALARPHRAAVEPVVRKVARQCGVGEADLAASIERLRQLGYLVSAPARVSRRPAAVIPTGAPVAETATVVVPTPCSAIVGDGGFELWDHDARRCVPVSAVELFAMGALLQPDTVAGAWARHCAAAGALALDRRAFAALIGRLCAGGFAVSGGGRAAAVPMYGSDGSLTATVAERTQQLRAVFARRAAEHDAAEAARSARTGTVRPRVIPVAFDACPPLGLGLIVAYATVYADGLLDEFYELRREWVWLDERLADNTARPAVYLFSNYLWSHAQCMQVSEQVKRLSPNSITIHGGPDTPKYAEDVEQYFRDHPSVDVTVRGEGEATAVAVLDALRAVIGQERPDLSVLAGVPGITYRDGDRVVRTPDRERITDLDAIPSPFLTGLFDAYGEVPGWISAVTETNRGCPYGCTFCDWGSATLSRMRQFSTERVYAEIDWCARNGMFCIGPADSNFGIFPRDVAIAERIAEAKRRYGYPKVFGVSYAKNSVKHLQHIIQTMAEAGILSHGILSLQTMDPDTLAVVRRSNIKTERYDQLAVEFRRSGLPLFVDLMLGLPGSTAESFRGDLQQCVDREVQVRIPQTTLLINSPMNDPAYRAEHGIETDEPFQPGVPRLVVASKSLPRADRDALVRLRLMFLLFENFGVLRQVSRFVRQETGIGEVALYERLRVDTERDPERWPMLRLLAAVAPAIMAAPGSWGLVIDELRTYLVHEIGVADDDALDTVLAVQRALLPAHGRALPATLELRHDYAQWYAAVLEAKEGALRDRWTEVVPRLRELPPATFTVDDPDGGVCRTLGGSIELHGFGLTWELESPVRRAFAPSSRSEPARAAQPADEAHASASA
jgi:hypothetical protein